SLQILREKGEVLGELVVSAASNLGMLDIRFGVSLTGGVFKAGRPILGPLEETVRAAVPHAEIVEARLPPECGAVVLLLRRAGVKVDASLVSSMKSSLASATATARRRAAASSRTRAAARPSR
ncbi:MAG: hypothetical protein ACRD6W_02390, partial [Nitrososphaerales archaeon]